MKVNVITLCSGYDSQCMALDRIKAMHCEFDYELIAWCEIDKYAIEAHNLVYPQWANRNLGDMTKVDWSAIKEPIDLLTYSTPCQDISNAGLQRGLGEGTRSGILWDTARAIETLRPRFLLQENVKALVSKKFMPDFQRWLRTLEELGYTSYWKVLNATQFGVPQNRERVFCASVRNDQGQTFSFPEGWPLDKTVEDVLEDEADEKFYLRDQQVDKFLDRIKAEPK